MEKVLNHIESDYTSEKERVLEILRQVPDPEIPVLSISDLGILRDIKLSRSPGSEEPQITIYITPTYSGCPAMDVIAMNIRMTLLANGYKKFNIETVLSPAWTTDWMTETGKQKLKAYGIAPPNPSHSVCELSLFQKDEAIQCPRCNSYNTKLISQFGSTACKAHYQCNGCLEPFDYFKCH